MNNNIDIFENILFINMKSRKDRLEHTYKEFEKINYKDKLIRIEAIKYKERGLGCSLSHLKCLKYAKEQNYKHVFICEDDITFTNPKILLDSKKKIENDINNNKLNWDVIIIGGNNHYPYKIINDYCVKINNCQTTTGYIVNSMYYDTLIDNYSIGILNLQKNYNNRMYRIDQYWKLLQNTGNWYLMTPLTVSQYSNYSDIEKEYVNYDRLMLSLNKNFI